MELVVLALGAGAAVSMWRHRVTQQALGPADPYTRWMIRYAGRQGYRAY